MIKKMVWDGLKMEEELICFQFALKFKNKKQFGISKIQRELFDLKLNLIELININSQILFGFFNSQRTLPKNMRIKMKLFKIHWPKHLTSSICRWRCWRTWHWLMVASIRISFHSICGMTANCQQNEDNGQNAGNHDEKGDQ